MPVDTKVLLDKIRALPAERISEVEDFVDFIRLREQQRALAGAAAAASEPAFAAVWSNPDDAAYDALGRSAPADRAALEDAIQRILGAEPGQA